MKTIILLAVICIVGVFSHHELTGEEKEEFHKKFEECATETGVQRQLLDDIKNHKEFTPTRELDCFSACLLKKTGGMNEDGTVVRKDDDTEKVTECKNLTGKDACETAGKLIGCFVKNGVIPMI